MLLVYILLTLYIWSMKLNTQDREKSGIYLIRNVINGKVYIGKAKCIYRRIKAHITDLNTKRINAENDHFIRAWYKYGKENFAYTVLEYLLLDDKLISKQELYYQLLYKSTDPNLGYNIRLDSSTGLIVSKETRLKLSIATTKRFSDPAERLKVSTYFKKYWKDNPDKLKEMSEKVGSKIRKYKFGKFDYNTEELLETFNTRKQLKDTYPEYYTQAILGCCQGNKNSYKGFKWKYIDITTNKVVKK